MPKKYVCHTSSFKVVTKWSDPATWKKGFWYPLPSTNNDERFPEDWPEGWGIYKLDENPLVKGDDTAMDCVTKFDLIFSQALELCEQHNGEKLF